MLRKLSLRQVGPAPKLDLRLAPRLNLLTGDNGLGKTFLLDIAWWALTRTWAGDAAWPSPKTLKTPRIGWEIAGSGRRRDEVFESEFVFERQSWTKPRGKSPMQGIVIYGRADGGFSVWDAARNLVSGSRTGSTDRPEAFHFRRSDLWDGLTEGGRVLCNGLIRDWVSWQQSGETAFHHLRKVLKGLSPNEEETLEAGPPVRVSLEDVRDVPTLAMSYGNVPLTHASAGFRRIVGLAYLLVWTWQEHLQAARLTRSKPADRIVLLIDEIEAHLHPHWQRVLLPAILEVVRGLTELDDLHIQLVVATHSPLILVSLEPEFGADRDKLFKLDLAEKGVAVEEEPWRPRGDASAWLTSTIFDLDSARSLPAERIIHRAMIAMSRPQLDLVEIRAIHAELRPLLSDTDPFWVRWLYRAEQAGLEL